jgi:uncharacterized membrane protein YfcA
VTIDWLLTLASFGVAIIVGMTGMGGGALMTPVLVFFFNIPPLTAVSSDLVAAAVMKPVGSAVHLRRGTVNLELVKWLCVGSVPAAFMGVFVARWLGSKSGVEDVVRYALGVALLLASAGLVAKAYIKLLERARRRDARITEDTTWREKPDVVVKPFVTALIGAVGGLVVGMTSVGSGSLIIVALLLVYPVLSAGQLVGTDLVQAVPLVASAAVAHILFGDFQLSITTSLLLGSIPGVYLGARISAYAPGGIIRRVLAVVLLASALKLLNVSTPATVFILLAVILVAPPVWMITRKRHGFPPLARREVARAVVTPD